MQAKGHKVQTIAQDRQKLRAAFRLVVQSVRNAQSHQSEQEKEKQMQRLLRQLRMAEGAR